jgi:hypothetical protein
VALSLLLATLVCQPVCAKGHLVPLDPQGEVDPDARDQAALERLFRDSYNRRYEGVETMGEQPESFSGAFYVFQKALILLLSDSEKLKEALKQGTSPWFDPAYPPAPLPTRSGKGTLMPSPQNIVPANTEGNAPQIYAPDFQTLERIRDLIDRVRSAERNKQTKKLASLNREFSELLREQLAEMERRIRENPNQPVIGMGILDGEDGASIVTLSPAELENSLDGLEGTTSSSGPAPPSSRVLPKGSRRDLSPEALKYFEKAKAGMNQPMTYAERVEFEMGLVNYGFELRSPEDPREGVPAYSPLDSTDPSEVFFGGAANLIGKSR